MVFHIEEVSDEGLGFRFQINKDQFQIDKEDYYLNKDIEVIGRLTRVGDEIYLKGKLNTELILKCSRCLDPLDYLIDSKLKAHFVPPDHNSYLMGEVELHAADIDKEVYEDGRIDLTQSILDGILLTVPVVHLCRNDCRGICSQCGKKLNQDFCKCSSVSSIDPSLEVLKKIKDIL